MKDGTAVLAFLRAEFLQVDCNRYPKNTRVCVYKNIYTFTYVYLENSLQSCFGV